MKSTTPLFKVAWCFLLFWGAPCFESICEAQSLYFSQLYDYNKTNDGGGNIFIKRDGTYFITAFAVNVSTQKYGMSNFTISADGSNVINKNILNAPTVNYYIGDVGAAKQFGSGYIEPFDPYQKFGFSGLILYDRNGHHRVSPSTH